MNGRVLIIAGSDSGGGAGIQADIKSVTMLDAFAATAITALTAQNTEGVFAVLPVAPDFIRRQIEVVLDDIGADAVKTGALLSVPIVEAVAAGLAGRGLPLVIDPVVSATTGRELTAAPAVDAMVRLLFPLATVVTPNLHEAEMLAGGTGTRRELAERIAARGVAAVLITGGHGEPVDHLFAEGEHVEIAVPRHDVPATHGAGCTHSATLAAALAKGSTLRDAAERAARVTAEAVRRGLTGIGAGEGPVDVLGLAERG